MLTARTVLHREADNMPRFAVTIAYIKEHIAALLQTHQTFKRIAFRRRTLEEELQEVYRCFAAAAAAAVSRSPLSLLRAGCAAWKLAEGVWRPGPPAAGSGDCDRQWLGAADGQRSTAICWVSTVVSAMASTCFCC